MPLTELQAHIAKLLAQNRTPDSHLAGGAAIHIQPNSLRYSNDLDYFHDSEERVAQAFAEDRALLTEHGYSVEVRLTQPGFVRALVGREAQSTKIEWAHDSAWRFLPPIRVDQAGYQLHPIDLAINKLLALVGRDEPRDFLDTLHVHKEVLPLGALCWAAAGKDPGFTPSSLLELLRRRGRYQASDFARLHLVAQPDLSTLKTTWLQALEQAEAFVQRRPPSELGCLYYHPAEARFVAPAEGDAVVPHYGRPGGVLPTLR